MPPVYWEARSNCLSVGIVNRLKAAGITWSSLRKQILDWADEQVRHGIEEMVRDYAHQFGTVISRERVEVFFSCGEICHDLVCATGVEMSKNRNFKRRFDEVIHNDEVTFSVDNVKHAMAKPTKPGADTSEGAKSVKVLRGYCKDGSIEKIYLKSIDVDGHLNRGETVFTKKALDFIFGDRHLIIFGENPILLSNRLKKLARIRNKRFSRMLAYRPLAARPLSKKRIKMAINLRCGKYAEEIFSCFVKWKTLSTGKSSILCKGARMKILAIAKVNQLFKKIDRATYSIDNKWMSSNYPLR
jgi:hypothetical protein